ncbi:hypothetical protein PSV08DRAFT_384611 [Bipolaris maydis]|uniref:uncharacterized protein n=1 Tax=Cochliobolus heterostrophus TaxID=5016 RepID=UPI0024D3CCA3|nr:hypothetical protein J3E73DRAFT_404498 [Bipolaris maydis]KAJ5065237.1 hypothetical protein J3E74DRAFT_434866 [Bipolaris maydis]KAJ6274929.1 hypothetical protein PSV08DRAFT_384611 [Bipolaris maydis]KAJ6285785.1 hypothetical protein J3E71DRAFT_374091 [Bipolaris maydis]
MCLIVVANGSFIVTTSALTLPTPPPPQHAAIPPSVLLADRTCEAVGVITKSDLSAVSSAQAVISQNFQSMQYAQTAVFNHPLSPGLWLRQPKTDCHDFQHKDHNYAALDEPTLQLHNPSFQPKLVECGRVTRQQMSLNG